MDWYLVRKAEQKLFHKGLEIPQDKKIFLSEDQVKNHNLYQEVVTQTKSPKSASECAVESEWLDCQKSNKAERANLKAEKPIADVKKVKSRNTDTEVTIKGK